MPLIAYEEKNFSRMSASLIIRANEIIAEYEAQGYSLTLRQIYYKFVTRNWLPEKWFCSSAGSTNNMKSYKKLGQILNDARLAGVVDWNALTDRTRSLVSIPSSTDVESYIDSISWRYDLDHWQDQEYRPEVWVEKDALSDVVRIACRTYNVPSMVCRGYVSQSAVWNAAQRFIRTRERGKTPILFYLTDHDPSGIDMHRDIQDRLDLFGAGVEVRRLALTMAQVEEFNCPPNPAKISDSRCAGYMDIYGSESWELDALEPSYIEELIRSSVLEFIDMPDWDIKDEQEETDKQNLRRVSQRWEDVLELINPDGDDDGDDE